MIETENVPMSDPNADQYPGYDLAVAEIQKAADQGADITDAFMTIENGKVRGVGGWVLAIDP